MKMNDACFDWISELELLEIELFNVTWMEMMKIL